MTEPPAQPERTGDEAFPPELPRTRRYTLAGEADMEHQVRQDLSRLSADAETALGGRMRSLLLIGRFARGEGGCVEHDNDFFAYGGYHCLALVDRLSPRDRHLLAELERAWSGHLRVFVQLHPVLYSDYARRHYTLWWLDLARGNIELLGGDTSALSALQPMELSSLPREEMGYLLAEQATLLALALHNDNASNLLRRQRLHNMALACGDAALLLHGRFAGGLRARHSQLKSLTPGKRANYYAEAIHFLERPDRWHVTQEKDWQQDVLKELRDWHLELEQQRCGAPTNLAGYVRNRRRLFEQVDPQLGLLGRMSSWLKSQKSPPSFPYVEEPVERLARAAMGLAYGSDEADSRLICARLLELPTASESRHLARLCAKLQALHVQVQQSRDDPAPIEFYA